MRNLLVSFSLAMILLSVSSQNVCGQNNVVDQIVAVVGNKIILKSDVENQVQAYNAQGMTSERGDLKTDVFEDLLIQQMLLAQAQIDSIEVTEQEVENQLDRRMEMYIQKAGSKDRLEQYFNKSIQEIKTEFREGTRNQLIKERMQAEITKDIRITPAEVRDLYSKVPKDSLPMIPGEVEIQQIVKYPKVSAEEKDRIRERLRGFRERILKGESFATKAVLYSEDKGSAHKGGELDYMTRAQLVPEFANEAFNLKPGRISKIVESEYGFHIIQLIDRKGEKINVRHILLKPKISDKQREATVNKLDSIANLIRNKKRSFGEAAFYFSDDKDTRNNGGLLVNQYTSVSKFQKEQLPPMISQQLQDMKVNEISDPFLDNTQGKEAYKIITLKSEIKAHRANINEDWTQFENMLKAKKQAKVMDKWIKEKQKSTYVHIDDSFKNSNFRYKGWIK